MKPIALWLQQQRPLVFFLYGQVFFLLGIATALQTRRFSRLVLARGLPWLSAFALLHAFYAWGMLFLPWQRSALSPLIALALQVLQVTLLALSFAALGRFGYLLSREHLPRPAVWEHTFWGVTVLWFGVLLIGLNLEIEATTWLQWSEALARYILGLPAALLAAYGLREQARHHLLATEMRPIYRTLQASGLALVAFAFLAGVVVPPLPFPPARWLNTATLERYVPTEALLTLIGALFTLAIIRGLEVFELETQRHIERMEQAQVLAMERERIARDLHDGALQRVYAAGLLAQTLRRQVQGPAAEQLERLLQALESAIAELRGFLNTLHQPSEGARSVHLHHVLQTLVEETTRLTGTEIHFQGDPVVLSAERAGHIIAFVREALANALRHAHSPRVDVFLVRHGRRLLLEVRDYGIGLPEEVDMGYGLRNMRDRAHLLGGEARFESAPNRGTRVMLDIPLEATL